MKEIKTKLKGKWDGKSFEPLTVIKMVDGSDLPADLLKSVPHVAVTTGPTARHELQLSKAKKEKK